MGKGGGGSGGGGGASSGTQETIQREAPGVESRKLALYDEAVKLAQQPVNIPAYQIAGPTGLEQTGFQQAATTGVGQPAVGQGIAGLQAGQQATNVGLGAALAGPNISQFFNPYQSYVTDEINRQAQIAQNQQAAQAVGAGAFGGGREGVQRAELDRARLEAIGQSRAQGFGTALQAAQNLQGLQAQTGLQAGAQFGQLGQALTGVGAQQQAMQQADIQSLLQAGGVQRALGQQALEAQRATSLAQQYEPYQRVEFLKNVMTNLPTGQSSITATTAPGSNPLAQAAGAGLGAYTAYNLLKRKEGGLVSIKKFQEGGAVTTPKKQEGVFSEQERFALLAAPVIGSLLEGRTAPGQSNLQALFGSVGKGVSQMPEVALQIKKLDIAGQKEGKDRTIVTRMSPDEIKAEGLPPGTIAERKTLITSSGALLNQGYDIKKQSDIAKLQDDVTKKQLPELDAKIQDVFTKFLPYVQRGESIPGIGVGGSLMVPFSQEARENRDSVAGIRNALLKIGAGTAQSKQETENIMQELAGGLFRTEEEFLKAIDRINARVNKEKEAIYAGYSDEEVKAFTEKTGLGIKPSLASLAKKTDSQKNEVPLEPGLPTYRIDLKNKTMPKVK
jgi:hypothetical protein